ncbi:Uncharacterized protein Rs2_05016 [Raphanus sativus]|nr:Uncharacterized protein Rs2_05016 [Raphanus sativus]
MAIGLSRPVPSRTAAGSTSGEDLREIPGHGDVTNEALSRSELEGSTLGWPPKTLSAGVDDIIFLFREIRSGEARVVNGTGAELDQARSDVQKLAKDRQKLSATKISNGEIAKAINLNWIES